MQRVIDAHGYVPSAAAHALEGGLSNTIAIVMPLSANPYFTRLFNAVYEEAAANGYYAWLFQIRENSPIPRSLIDEIIRRRIDGVIFAGGIWSEERSGLSDRSPGSSTTCPPSPSARRRCTPDCICIHSDLVSCSACRFATCTRWVTGASHSSAARYSCAIPGMRGGKLPARAAGAGPAG